MPSLIDRVLGTFGLQRSFNPFLPGDFERILNGYGSYPQTTMGNSKQEPIGQGFYSLVTQAYAQNPVVFACINARAQLFSEARFQFQRMLNGRPGELVGNPATYLRLLETPWAGGTTSAMLKDMLIDADIAGNAFRVRRPTQIARLRPDWVTIIAGSENPNATTWDPDVEVLGYGYQPGGPQGGQPKQYFQASEVAHFVSTRDPLSRWRGMPWLLPVLTEIDADIAATSHKTLFWQNAATPNMAIQYDVNMQKQAVQQWVDEFKKNHEGAANAYKTLFLGGGATVVPVGSNLQQADFSKVQSGGELRIASAAGVPPIIIGLAGGLDAATYSNYGQARRAFSDLTMRPLWRDVCGALERITSVPENSRLWYDDRDIPFLQEDMKDSAEIQSTQAVAIRQLVDAGFDAKTIIDAVVANDFNRLKHTGLFSVQLQPPMPDGPPKPPAPNQIEPAQTNAGRSEMSFEVRCSGCERKLADRAGKPYRFTCPRCKAVTDSDSIAETASRALVASGANTDPDLVTSVSG